MTREEFWYLLIDRCNEPYISKFVNDLSNMKTGISRDDIIADCYVYFIEDNCKRLDKIQNENGAKIAILNRFRRVYRVYKKKNTGIENIDSYFTEYELIKMKELHYTDFQKRLATFFLERVRMLDQLNINHTMDSNKRPNRSWYKKEISSIIFKTDRKYRTARGLNDFMEWCPLDEDERNLLLYFKSSSNRIKNFNISDKYLRGSRIDDYKAIGCMKEIYARMMAIVWSVDDGN